MYHNQAKSFRDSTIKPGAFFLLLRTTYTYSHICQKYIPPAYNAGALISLSFLLFFFVFPPLFSGVIESALAAAFSESLGDANVAIEFLVFLDLFFLGVGLTSDPDAPAAPVIDIPSLND